MSKAFQTLKAAARDFLDDECMVSGAALAYYTIFSLPPLLVIVFYTAGLLGVSDQKISEVVGNQLGMPSSGLQTSAQPANQLAAGSDQASESTSMAKLQLGPLSKIVGVGLLMFSATGVFVQLQRSLNRAWEVEPDPEAGGVKNFLAKRGLSLGMIIVIAFLLLVSLGSV